MNAGVIRRRDGFSLIEILVSLGLMAFLITTATLSFLQVRTITNRVRARQAMHGTARIIAERFRQEFGSLMQSGAFWMSSSASGVGGAWATEMVFLRGRKDFLEYRLIGATDTRNICDGSDLSWLRIHWDQGNGVLSVGENVRSRRFQVPAMPASWSSTGRNYKDKWFAILPEPRRLATLPMDSTLNGNAWNTGSPGDFGDYEDLLRRSIPVTTICTECVFEVVAVDGTTQQFEAGIASQSARNGVLMDGSSLAAEAKARPALIRLRMTLTDQSVHLDQDFSFSFPVGAIQPDGL